MWTSYKIIAYIDRFVEFGREVFCRWSSKNACGITLLMRLDYDCASAARCSQQSNPNDKNSNTLPTDSPGPTTSCSSNPSQKHQAQETGTYEAKELLLNIPKVVLYQAHNGMPYRNLPNEFGDWNPPHMELTSKRSWIARLRSISSATETPFTTAFAIVRKAQDVETTLVTVSMQSAMHNSMHRCLDCCINYYVWVSEMFLRNAPSTMLFQREPPFFIHFHATDKFLDSTSVRESQRTGGGNLKTTDNNPTLWGATWQQPIRLST